MMTLFHNPPWPSVRRVLLTLFVSVAPLLSAPLALAGAQEQAKRIYDRLTGSLPGETILQQMTTAIEDDGNGVRAAGIAIDNAEDHSFYNVTLKNWASPWTNRDFDVFAQLNDYTATAIGVVRDEIDFRRLLYDDIIYVGRSGIGLPPYAANNNEHYANFEAGLELNGDPGYSLKDDLERRVQSEVIPTLATGGAVNGASGVVTTRAGAKAFLIAGTNRAAFRFTMLNHLCLDMEQVHDVTRIPDRIRQDVSRSPAGDSRLFLSNCIGCHSGMDPLTQALAYHNYQFDADSDPEGNAGQIEYTPGVVQGKYFNNNATFPAGFITPDDQWANYWRAGKNVVLGWDAALEGRGQGASSMYQELAHTDAFAQCHVRRVFRTVCLRDPQDSSDRDQVAAMLSEFQSDGHNLKRVFARSADYCKGE